MSYLFFFLVVEPNLLEAVIRGAAHAVIQAEPEITYYDTVLGDGDCGQTLKTAASSETAHSNLLL